MEKRNTRILTERDSEPHTQALSKQAEGEEALLVEAGRRRRKAKNEKEKKRSERSQHLKNFSFFF